LSFLRTVIHTPLQLPRPRLRTHRGKVRGNSLRVAPYVFVLTPLSHPFRPLRRKERGFPFRDCRFKKTGKAPYAFPPVSLISVRMFLAYQFAKNDLQRIFFFKNIMFQQLKPISVLLDL
jgi:hypothetical protein